MTGIFDRLLGNVEPPLKSKKPKLAVKPERPILDQVVDNAELEDTRIIESLYGIKPTVQQHALHQNRLGELDYDVVRPEDLVDFAGDRGVEELPFLIGTHSTTPSTSPPNTREELAAKPKVLAPPLSKASYSPPRCAVCNRLAKRVIANDGKYYCKTHAPPELLE